MTEFKSNFILATGYGREISLATLAFYCFTVGNLLLAAHQTRNRTYLLVALGMAMVVTGREILFYRIDVISIIVGFVLVIVGTTLFGERTHAIHLWS